MTKVNNAKASKAKASKATNAIDVTNKYASLMPLSKTEMRRYVDSDWHHACLSKNNMRPTDDCRGNDYDYTFEEIKSIHDTYGKSPPLHWEEYWTWKNKLSASTSTSIGGV